MHGLLAPAIALMNRLSYAQKFGVISLTFFIPLLVLSFIIVNQTYEEIVKSQEERDSINVIGQVLDVVDKGSIFRDYASAETFYKRDALTDVTNQLENAFFKSLNQLLHNNRANVVGIQIEKKKESWKKNLSRVGENKQSTIVDQYKLYDQVIKDVLYLAKQAAQSSGISQDTNEDVQIFMKLVLTDYPLFQSNLGFSHGVGVMAIVEQYIMTGTYDILNNAYDSLDSTQKAIKKVHGSLLNGKPEYNPLFAKSFTQAEENIGLMIQKLDEELISATSVEISWQSFSENFQKNTQVLTEIRSKVLVKIADILQQRIDSLTKKLLVVVVAIGFVMLLIVYLYAAFFWSVRSTVGGFHNAARKISKGDMRVRVEVFSNDEMGQLTGEFNVMVEQIHSLLKAVHKTATEVATAMNLVGQNAEKSSLAANEQLQQTEQVASAVTEMSATAEEVNRQSAEASVSANNATNQAGAATKIVGDTLTQIQTLADEIMRSTDVINQLSENSDNIASMLAVIKGIAEQTNLLALNAAIEAARAGEQGRGFAVVADEVRTLASRTQTSAQEIEKVMTSIHSGISSAVDVMSNSHMMAQDTVESSSSVRNALDEIVKMVQSINSINSQISLSADEQTQVAKAIDENVVKINDLGKATVTGADHTVSAIKEVMALTASLQEKLERFQV